MPPTLWRAATTPPPARRPGGSGFPPTTTIQTQLTAQQRADLLVFLQSIAGTTARFRSEGEVFRDALRL